MEKWKKICERIGKDRFLVLIIGGLLLLVITFPLPDGKGEQADSLRNAQSAAGQMTKETTETTPGAVDGRSDTTYVTEMEGRLSDVLSDIYGAGEVRVFISLEDYGSSHVEKDVSYSRDNEERADGETQMTASVTTENTEESIYTTNDAGDEVPFVSRTLAPKVAGVLVVAQGGRNESVCLEMKEAIMALFGIDEHKIKVVRMKGEER